MFIFKQIMPGKTGRIKIVKPLHIMLLISIISGAIFLSGCGGGGGGGNSAAAGGSGLNSGSGGNSGSGQNNPPSGVSNTMNIYIDEFVDEGTVNIPYVNVYVDGNATPIPLLLDTGATGIIINQSALNGAGIYVPSSGYNFSGSFADGETYGGYIGYATVSSLASGGVQAQNIPIAVNTDYSAGSAFGTGFLQGDFGIGMSPYYSFGNYNGRTTLFTPSFISGLPGNYNNGFILNFNGVGFNQYGYSIISSPDASPVGTITFGLNTFSDNFIPPGSNFYPNVSGQKKPFPVIQSKFGAYTSDSGGHYFYSFFDTGSNFIFLGTDAINYAVENGASTSDVISSGPCQYILYGGLSVNLYLYDAEGNYDGGGFITDPDNSSNNSFCDYKDYSAATAAGGSDSSAVALDNVVYYGEASQNGQEDLGLPYIFNQPMYWQVQSQGSAWGVGIEP